MIEWLFFDIGSTLLDESESVRVRIESTVDALRGTSQKCSFITFWSLMKQAAAHHAHPYAVVMKELGSDVFIPWQKEFERPFPYTVQLLETLHPQYRLGIIANQSVGTRQHLGRWNLDGYFDVIISSSEVGMEKPDPKIFILALLQAHCSPENAVMIGDRLDNDIYPAKKLGIKTIWVRQGWGGMALPISNEYEPDYSVNSLSEIPNILKGMS